MKTIAFYLPQFHSIPENDAWWGKGFTEWDNVKKTKPLFRGHHQPVIPFGGNYYNLLDTGIQEKQAEIAKKYGLYGFCYYHYWFSGKLLLEKPMENMLKNNNVDIPFCVCWANETWSRTWDGNASEVLIEQDYDENKEMWKKHFEYLLPFFKDNRYIKCDNKPMMILYKPQLFSKCKDMVYYWNELAVSNGFSGIYWGYQHRSAFDSDLSEIPFDFGIEFEPFYTVKEIEERKEKRYRNMGVFGPYIKNLFFITWKLKKKILKQPILFNYDDIWKNILDREPSNTHVCPGAFTAWDNSPRRGLKGSVFKGASPDKFELYLKRQFDRAEEVYCSEFLFINAWNEWAEGAHLEPDEFNGYGYLEALKKVSDNHQV